MNALPILPRRWFKRKNACSPRPGAAGVPCYGGVRFETSGSARAGKTAGRAYRYARSEAPPAGEPPPRPGCIGPTDSARRPPAQSGRATSRGRSRPRRPPRPVLRPRGAAQPTPIGRVGWAVGCASALHARGPKPRPVLFERGINQRPDFNIAAYHTVSARRGGRRPRRPALPVFPVIPLAAGQPVTGISAAALPAPAEPPAPGFDTGTIRLPLGLCALSTHIPPPLNAPPPFFRAHSSAAALSAAR